MSWARAFHLACTASHVRGFTAPHLRNPVILASLAIRGDIMHDGCVIVPVRVDTETSVVTDVWETFSDTDMLAKWTSVDGDDIPCYFDDSDEAVWEDEGSFVWAFEAMATQAQDQTLTQDGVRYFRPVGAVNSLYAWIPNYAYPVASGKRCA